METNHGSNGKRSPDFSERPSESPLARLTRREREVALLISRGRCNKEISVKLEISERTVKAHLSTIFLKLGVSDRLQLALHLVRRAISAGETTSKSS